MDDYEIAELSHETFLEFIKVIHLWTGITIGSARKSMVEGRLRKRVKKLRLRSYPEYLTYLQATPEEKHFFVDQVTTNETYFLRTPRIWNYLEKTFLPEWHRTHPDKTFMAWSAAASSGAEAHTLAVLCEEFRSKNPSFCYQILGTDISDAMVSLCKEGLYSGRTLEAFKAQKPEYLKKHMVSADTVHFSVQPNIRNRLKFQAHNLFEPLKTSEKFDLVLLRNVLIYFTPTDQERVLRHVNSIFKPDGLLIIGESETLSLIETEFVSVEPIIYSRKAA